MKIKHYGYSDPRVVNLAVADAHEKYAQAYVAYQAAAYLAALPDATEADVRRMDAAQIAYVDAFIAFQAVAYRERAALREQVSA